MYKETVNLVLYAIYSMAAIAITCALTSCSKVEQRECTHYFFNFETGKYQEFKPLPGNTRVVDLEKTTYYNVPAKFECK